MLFASVYSTAHSCEFIMGCVLSNFGAFLFIQGGTSLERYGHCLIIFPLRENICLGIRRKTNNETREPTAKVGRCRFEVVFLTLALHVVSSRLCCHDLEGGFEIRKANVPLTTL